jgi:hypothetical protein
MRDLPPKQGLGSISAKRTIRGTLATINVATRFFTVFLVRQPAYDMTVVMGLSIVGQLAILLPCATGGHLADRFTNKSVLLLTAPAYIASIVAMIDASQFTDPP